MNTIQKIGAALAAVVLLTGIVAGCGSQNSGPQSSPSQNGESNQPERQANESTKSDSENSGQEQQTGGTVRVAIATEPDNLDPYLSAATDTYSMMDNVYDGLLEVNPDGSLRPAIAESYDISEDGLTYTFRLRQNVVFHDGSPLTSEDVRASYARLAGLNGAEALSSKFSSVESIETPDDHTVVIHLSENDAAFLAANTEEILPSDYENHSEKPIGAGPYQFVEYVPGQELVLEKFESFYDKAHFPSIDRVEFKFITDSNAAVLALQAGDIDLYPGISEQGVMQLGDGFHYVRGPQNMVQLMALNHEVEPLDDVKVRQAVNFAIDTRQIIETVAEGHGTRLGSNMSPAMKMYYQEGLVDVYNRDLEKAASLLKEAGLENGFDLTITVPSNYQFHVDTAQVIADQLKEAGIRVNIDPIEWSSWLEDVYKNEKYEATIIGLTGKLDPHEVLGRYESSYERNFYNFHNREYDRLIEQARTEIDENKRAGLYKQAQTILTEQAVAVYIMDPNRTVAMRPDLQGFNMYPVQKYNMAELYYAE